MEYRKDITVQWREYCPYNKNYILKDAKVEIYCRSQKVEIEGLEIPQKRFVTSVILSGKYGCNSICHERDEKTFSVIRGTFQALSKIFHEAGYEISKFHRQRINQQVYARLKNCKQREAFETFARHNRFIVSNEWLMKMVDEGCVSVGGLAVDLGLYKQAKLPGSFTTVVSY